jgi:uncharacterized protein (DUF488 family)
MSTIWTIGHGRAPIESFGSVLAHAGIQTLVDVRTKPYSRWNPQFNRAALEYFLQGIWTRYMWAGDSMGGLGVNIGQDEAVAGYAHLAETERIALMCSESRPEHCHRKTMLTPLFLARGINVWHLLPDGTAEPEPIPTEPERLF